MNIKKTFATIAITTILLTGCTFNDKPIIKVNGENITQSQFNKAFKDEVSSNPIFKQMGIVAGDKKNPFYLLIKNNVTDELIEKTLLNQEIKKKHINVTKADTDKELNTAISKLGSKAIFDELLKKNGISASQFKKDLYEKIKMEKLVEATSNIEITDTEAKKYYNQNLDKYKHPEQIRASHILIAASPKKIQKEITSNPMNKNLSQAQIQEKVNKELSNRLEKAKQILAEVQKNPADFGKIAKAKSDDKGSAIKDGDLGFFTKTGFIEPFTKTAFSQKLNTVGDIVQTRFGYHIILVTDKMKAGQESFEQAKSSIVDELKNQAETTELNKLKETLKKQAKIEYVAPDYNPISIQEIMKKNAKPYTKK